VRHDSENLIIKKTKVLESLKRYGRVMVALSGGVDSAVVLALAVEALGPDRVLAVTGASSSVPESEIDDARDVARRLGVSHEVVPTFELERERYRANLGDRCFHCRTELFGVLGTLASERGFDAIAYGAILDDAGDHRPGMRAAEDRGILAPLLDAGIGKAEVRVLAAAADLPVREKPAAACLASRIPPGTEVTPERLAQVERAESGIRNLGFRQLRVRHHGDVARVELDDEGIARLASPETRAAVVAVVKAAGFRFVALDLEGYRTGSLNPVLHRIRPAREGGQ
jgi:uncharacterized protein